MKDYQGYFAHFKPLIAAMLLAGQSRQQVADFISVAAYGRRLDARGPSADMIGYMDRRWSGTYRSPKQRKLSHGVRNTGSWTPEDVWRETEGLK